jgi:SAM-dependent methyltransferase
MPDLDEDQWFAEARSLRRETRSAEFRRRVGLRRWAEMLAAPITSFTRLAEFEAAARFLALRPGLSFLDLAGPKIFGLVLARRFSLEARLTDIWEDEVAAWKAWAECAGWSSPEIRFEACDARHTDFPDMSFDRVAAISVVEHIDGDGDSSAMSEIGRVLKPGGIAVVSVPFSRDFKKKMTQSRLYGVENPGKSERLFERIYDQPSLEQRLLRPSGLLLEEATALGLRPSLRSRLFAKTSLDTVHSLTRRDKLEYLMTLPFFPAFARLSRSLRYRTDPGRLPASLYFHDIVLKLVKKGM